MQTTATILSPTYFGRIILAILLSLLKEMQAQVYNRRYGKPGV
jgi:hypothetical protein